VSFLPEALQWVPFTKGDYWVLKIDADYQSALVGEPSRNYLWLLHRQGHMERSVAEEWLNVARMQGYDLSDLIWPEQSGAVYPPASA
jgi:apolipoprotein D and lipocalin family protein